MLDLNDLRLFVHIVEYRGILRAARALRLPKSTVSRRLGALEEQVKSRLVIRSGEDFALTDAGERTYALAKGMVEAAERAEEGLLGAAAEVGSTVTIAASPVFAPMLPPVMAALLAQMPTLRLAVEPGDTGAGVVSDTVDLHLRAHGASLPDTTLIQRRIGRSPLILAAAPGLAVPAGDTPGVWAAAGLLAWSGVGAGGWRFSDPQERPFVLDAAPRLVSGDASQLAALAAQGAGVILAPRFALEPDLATGRLVRVASAWTGPPVTVTLLMPPRRLMGVTLRRVADRLGDAIKARLLLRPEGVPHPGQGVPPLPPPDFTGVSQATVNAVGEARPPSAGPPTQPLAEGETPMIPTMKAAGLAAMIAAPALAQDAPGPLVLYTNDFEGVITERFEADTGREIDVVQMSGGELLARIAAEANNPQWDVLIFNGSYTFQMLDGQAQLKRDLAPANLGNLNETGLRFMPENRAWMPIGLVASCVMLYRHDLVDSPPADFADLADARFNGLFGMADPAVAAPAYPCVASFFHDMGEDAAKALFTSYFDNGMRVFRTNGPVGRAIVSGDIHVALITSQVAYSQIASGEPLTVVWPEAGAPGSVRGAGVQASTARPEAALAFIDWLLEPATQSFLAAAVPADGLFEPTVTGAVRRADGPPEGVVYRVAPDAFAVEHEEAIKTWFADQALN